MGPLLTLISACVLTAEPPDIRAVVDHPIVVARPDTSVVLSVSGPRGMTVSWSQVADRINPARTSGTATITARDGGGATATVAVPGVYQFQAEVTLADGTGPTLHPVWVAAWDPRTALDPGPTLGCGTGMTPPAVVRRLTPNPAPGRHPRILFSREDWSDLHQRAATGAVARWGVTTLTTWVGQTLENRTTPCGTAAAAFTAWATAGCTGEEPDTTVLNAGSVLSNEARGVFTAMVMDACYLAWIEQDPAVPPARTPPALTAKRTRLAQLASATAELILRHNWSEAGGFRTGDPLFLGNLHVPGTCIAERGIAHLAMAYDLAYDWMDEAQRRPLRDLLFLAGWGRHLLGFDNRGRPNLGTEQNNDFANLSEHLQLAAFAIEGEESAVSPAVRRAVVPDPATPPRPWMRPADPADPAAWPTATQASVDNLQRELRWMVEWFLTPWGLEASHLSYWGLSGRHLLPTVLAFARRGENPFITTPLYQMNLHALLSQHPGEGKQTGPLGETNRFLWDHHDCSGYGQRSAPYVLAKYMFPEDPLIDLVYRSALPFFDRDPLIAAIFGLDPLTKAQPPEQVATAKQLPLTVFDPLRGIVSTRSGWRDDDLSLWFDCGGADPSAAHMHAEKNSFDLFALGRAWSIAPGYHVTISDAQAAVLIRDPARADDPATGGFYGESGSSLTQTPPQTGNFPTPPGRMLEVREAPDHGWTLMAGDASACYAYGLRGPHGPRTIDTGLAWSDFLYPGVLDWLAARAPEFRDRMARHMMVSQDDYNPMHHAFRTILVVRGRHPYALVCDDIAKDDQPHDWQWTMNGAMGFAPGLDRRFVDEAGKGVYSSTAIESGATPAQAVLYHRPIDAGNRPGLPRLLVRDLGRHAGGSGQPAMVLQSRPPGDASTPHLTYGADNNRTDKAPVAVPTNRLLIERHAVTTPDFTVLLWPYRSGEALPTTTWDGNRGTLTITTGDGQRDAITIDGTNPDHRRRLGVARGGH